MSTLETEAETLAVGAAAPADSPSFLRRLLRRKLALACLSYLAVIVLIAIFAPIFVPLFLRLDVAPQTVLAAYRLGDSPMNVITPLMVYLPFIVLVAQRYKKDAGLGTIISLMLPYTAIVLVTWLIFFIVWYLIGIPMGPGYPTKL